MSSKVTILITGASKGIGLEIVSHYLSLGHHIISISRTPSVEAENHIQYLADITKENQVMEVIKDLKTKKIVIDILINNAGIANMNFMISSSVSTATEIMQTNFTGVFLITREVSKMMIRQNKGR